MHMGPAFQLGGLGPGDGRRRPLVINRKEHQSQGSETELNHKQTSTAASNQHFAQPRPRASFRWRPTQDRMRVWTVSERFHWRPLQIQTPVTGCPQCCSHYTLYVALERGMSAWFCLGRFRKKSIENLFFARGSIFTVAKVGFFLVWASSFPLFDRTRARGRCWAATRLSHRPEPSGRV